MIHLCRQHANAKSRLNLFLGQDLHTNLFSLLCHILQHLVEDELDTSEKVSRR